MEIVMNNYILGHSIEGNFTAKDWDVTNTDKSLNETAYEQKIKIQLYIFRSIRSKYLWSVIIKSILIDYVDWHTEQIWQIIICNQCGNSEAHYRIRCQRIVYTAQ